VIEDEVGDTFLLRKKWRRFVEVTVAAIIVVNVVIIGIIAFIIDMIIIAVIATVTANEKAQVSPWDIRRKARVKGSQILANTKFIKNEVP